MGALLQIAGVDALWEIIITAVSFIAVFGTIVLFHELGHFAVAKAFGVKVFEFAIGIGPAIARMRRGETQYSLRLLPLGGFVKLAGMNAPLREEDAEVEDDPSHFNRKPIWQRMLVVFAGPFMNFFLAFLLIAGYHMIVYVPPTVTGVNMGGPADISGIMPGDVIVKVEGEPTRSAAEVIDKIQPNAGRPIEVELRRRNQPLTVTVTPRLDHDAGVGIVGIEIWSQPRLGFFTAVTAAVQDVWRGTIGIIRAIGDMIFGRTAVDLRGPIGIITITGEAARQGFGALLTLAIGLNLNLGLLNLFPIPVLDGGWLVLLGWEGIRGKPLAPEQQGMAQFIGLVIILLLMIFAFYQDVLHLRT